MRLLLLTSIFILFNFHLINAQHNPNLAHPNASMNSAEIKLALKKLNTVGSALYVAAHPDDENTAMITYLSKGVGVETTYLSLTRGDGGQNLIGKEVRERLGIIRTQELLAARRTDGGNQLFSRANDFGFSKHPDETFNIWDKENVLADAVWAIRKLKPDVIITRFSPNRAGKTHGHHTSSAIIAKEAFEAAADPKRYPEQLQYVEPWQAKRVMWNTSWWFFRGNPKFDKSKLLQFDVGAYNPLLGRSYGEIASMSRTQHKSQGFGSSLQRGFRIEYIEHINGEKAEKDIFEGIDLTWKRIEGGEKIGQMLSEIIDEYQIENPSLSLPKLVETYKALKALPAKTTNDQYWVNTKKAALENIIIQCASVYYEVTSKDYSITPADSIHLTARILRRADYPVKLNKVDFGIGSLTIDSALRYNEIQSLPLSSIVPKETPITQPYWLVKPEQKGMFQVDNQKLIGLPENKPPFLVSISMEIGGEEIEVHTPVFYKWTDPVDGERYRPLEITPAITVNMEQPVFIFADNQSKVIPVLVKSHAEKVEGILKLEVPEGWRYEPSSVPLNFTEKYAELNTAFEVFPPEGESIGQIKAVVEMGNQITSHSLTRIDYPHIPIQTLFPVAQSKIVRLNIKTNGEKIGYIAGAGDVIPESLREIGYTVDILADEDITHEKLQQYDVIITGVRAYNTNPRMKFHQEKLMQFVEDGGNMIVQYNTSRRLGTPELGPYPLTLSRDRVTVEEAPMKLLAPKHDVVNYPNKLTDADFDGWVQERGLYFPNEWDENYTPIFECNDPGEDPKQGSMLVADYGRGSYIYTGLSFFRELPAGVSGAYRLFTNMISYRNPQTVKIDRAK